MGAEVAAVAGRVTAGAAEGADGFDDRLVEEDDVVVDVEEDEEEEEDDFASAFCFF